MGSGYSVEHMQIFVNVVTGREWKMLGIPFAAGTEVPSLPSWANNAAGA
jgi:hypothetical protein